jgi:hypothetical protein
MAEMMTRAAKQLCRGAMRMADSELQLRLVVVNTFNLLFGTSAASVSFYETAMQLQLRSKYGSYGEVFEAGADYRHSFDPTALFTRLTYVLGIRFTSIDSSKDALLSLFERSAPFSISTPFEIVQRVKPLITDADIADFARTAPVTTSTADLELFRQAVASLQLPSLQLVVKVQLARLLLRDCQAQKRAVPMMTRKVKMPVNFGQRLLVATPSVWCVCVRVCVCMCVHGKADVLLG